MNNRYQTLPKTTVKTHCRTSKAYWCAPRKVKNINSNDSLATTGKSKKKRRRKVRKTAEKPKRIDILAQPKSGKQRLQQKHHSASVTEATRKRKSIVHPRKSLNTNNHRTADSLVANCTTKTKLQNSLGIVLPKKLWHQLLSLVTKKLKEWTTNSGNMEYKKVSHKILNELKNNRLI